MRYSWYAGFIALSIAAIASPARGASDNSQITNAGKQVHTAAAAAEAARAEINQIRIKIKAQLSTQPEWSAALANLRLATTALAQARRDALAALAKDPAYQQLVRDRDQARTTLSTASDDKADAAQVQNAGDLLMQRAFEIKRREEDALNQNTTYAQAKAKVDELRAKVDQLDAQVADAEKNDPAYDPAMNKLKAAETQLTTARQQLAQAVQADRDQRAARLKAEQQQQGGFGY